MTLESEIGALRRIAHRRLPSIKVAYARVLVKRRLRRRGIVVPWDIPTRQLILLGMFVK